MVEKADYIWLSFRNPDLNQNLGCVIIKATNLEDAVQKAWDLKVNPGGEVAGFPMTEENVETEGLEIDRLYSKKELMEMKYRTISDITHQN